MRMLVGMIALGLAARVASAQQPRLSLRFDAANVWARSDAPGSSTALSGPALGGEGRIAWGRFFLSVRYLEGRLQASSGTAGQPRQDLVDGAILLAARPVSWLELAVGPAARAYVTDSTTERWTVWRVRTRIEAPLTRGLSSYLELWRAFASDVNVPAGPGRVQGNGDRVPAARALLAALLVSHRRRLARSPGAERNARVIDRRGGDRTLLAGRQLREFLVA
jgi:hypothetical protein